MFNQSGFPGKKNQSDFRKFQFKAKYSTNIFDRKASQEYVFWYAIDEYANGDANDQHADS